MKEDNVQLARRWFDEVWNQKREETIYELLAPDGLCYSDAGVLRGHAGFMDTVYKPFLDSFSEIHVKVEDTLADGENVVVRWQVTGKHTGPGLGIPPSGKPVAFRGITWIRYEDGKMKEGWESWDRGGLIESLKS